MGVLGDEMEGTGGDMGVLGVTWEVLEGTEDDMEVLGGTGGDMAVLGGDMVGTGVTLK